MDRAWILALLLLTVPLVGCIGGDDSGDDIDQQERAQFSEDTGGIQGVVTNPAIEAIAEATVTIDELRESTETAADGSFAFSDVTPGTYTLVFEADGFLSTEQEVNVPTGDVTSMDVILTEEPSQTPYMQQREFHGFVECSVATPVIAAAVCAIPNSFGGNTTNDRFMFTFAIEPNAWQMVAEVEWDASNPLGERNSMNVEPEGLSNDGKTEFGGAVGESPLIVRSDRERFAEVDQNTTAVCDGEKEPESAISASQDAYCNRNYIEEGGGVQVRMFVSNTDLTGQGVPTGGAAIQQDFRVVVSTFYHAPACEEYSLFEDNLCEQPAVPPEEDPADDVDVSGG